MKFSGVVVLYNPDKNISDNINSYLDELEVLYVIDNNEDEKNKLLLPMSRKIIYMPNFSNVGIAKALNQGASKSIEEGFQWMLTMDQDSKFKTDELEKMLSFIKSNKDDKIGVVSPWHCTNANDPKPNTEIDYPLEVMTSGNIINLNIYNKIGRFKEWLFIDCVDFDYCMNMKVNGYKVVRLNYVNLEHQLGEIKVVRLLGRNLVCSNHNYIRRYYITRNVFYIDALYRDHFPEYCSFIKRGLKGGLQNIVLFESDKIRKVKYMYKGYRDFKKGVRGMLKG